MKDKIVKAIILAGGYSRRMKSKVPKQLLRIGRKPLLAHTLDVFERSKAIDKIILVAHHKIVKQCRDLIKKYGYKKVEQLVRGGSTRQQSVYNALNKISGCDYLVIHDGVRPFVSRKIIINIVKAVKKYNAATCAVKAKDTIAQARADNVDAYLAREKLWHIQTPQAFKFAWIVQAHQRARAGRIFNASDDAQLLLRLKKKIKITEGSYRNIKLTTISDLLLAKKISRERP